MVRATCASPRLATQRELSFAAARARTRTVVDFEFGGEIANLQFGFPAHRDLTQGGWVLELSLCGRIVLVTQSPFHGVF
jgi:hypothetical protein